jgi:hypothetical protein
VEKRGGGMQSRERTEERIVFAAIERVEREVFKYKSKTDVVAEQVNGTSKEISESSG